MTKGNLWFKVSVKREHQSGTGLDRGSIAIILFCVKTGMVPSESVSKLGINHVMSANMVCNITEYRTDMI